MKCLDGETKKDLLNSLVYWLSRPYALALAAAFVFTPATQLAQALESGADFLNIGAGARASALGSAYTALADDANSIYYNPAGLAGLAAGADLVLSGHTHAGQIQLPGIDQRSRRPVHSLLGPL